MRITNATANDGTHKGLFEWADLKILFDLYRVPDVRCVSWGHPSCWTNVNRSISDIFPLFVPACVALGSTQPYDTLLLQCDLLTELWCFICFVLFLVTPICTVSRQMKVTIGTVLWSYSSVITRELVRPLHALRWFLFSFFFYLLFVTSIIFSVSVSVFLFFFYPTFSFFFFFSSFLFPFCFLSLRRTDDFHVCPAVLFNHSLVPHATLSKTNESRTTTQNILWFCAAATTTVENGRPLRRVRSTGCGRRRGWCIRVDPREKRIFDAHSALTKGARGEEGRRMGGGI